MGVKDDTKTLPGKTEYFSIPAHRKAAVDKVDLTGVYVPAGLAAGGPVRLLIYLHGQKNKHPEWTVRDYWADPRWPLRSTLEATPAAADTVLVVPSASASGRVKRIEADPEAYLEALRAALGAPALLGERAAELGGVVWCGHSAGGVPLLEIAQAMTGGEGGWAIEEIWSVDALYSGSLAKRWAKLVGARGDVRFRFAHATPKPKRKIESLKGLVEGAPNFEVLDLDALQPGDVKHDDAPVAAWRQWAG